jgi:hypothetical protein
LERAKNCDIEYKEREPECTTGFLNGNPIYDQMDINPDVHTQSIFPRAFKARQEDRISLWRTVPDSPHRGTAE